MDSLRTMEALITREADSMSAMKFRMNKADKAMWMDMKVYKNKGIAEGRKHRRYREVVQSCLLHSSESWSWNKEMIDALHGWESMNLDLMSSRRWAQMGMSLEWFRTNQIRKARQRFVDGGEGGNIENLLLLRIWNYKEKIFDEKRNKETDNMMRNILRHANAERREQRSVCAKILDPRNQNKMKRRRAGGAHTNWDNLWTKWSGSQRWWEGLGDWKRFIKTAEETRKRSLIKDVDKKKEGSREEIKGNVQRKKKRQGENVK